MAFSKRSPLSGQAWVGHGWILVAFLVRPSRTLGYSEVSPLSKKFSHALGIFNIFSLATQEAFGGCASLAASCGWKLWYLRPKLHMFLHVVCHGWTSTVHWTGVVASLLTGESHIPSGISSCVFFVLRAELEYQVSLSDYILNPLCWKLSVLEVCKRNSSKNCFVWTALLQGYATWADEDFIGRVSRQSRKVHSLAVSFRTISKTLMNYKYEWDKVCPRSVRPGPVRWESGTVKGHDEKVHVQCHHFAIGRGGEWVRWSGVWTIIYKFTWPRNSNTFLQNVRFLESHAQHKPEHKRMCFWRSRYIYIKIDR